MPGSMMTVGTRPISPLLQSTNPYGSTDFNPKDLESISVLGHSTDIDFATMKSISVLWPSTDIDFTAVGSISVLGQSNDID